MQVLGPQCEKPSLTKTRELDPIARLSTRIGCRKANREGEGWVIKDGIIVVIKDSVIYDNTII